MRKALALFGLLFIAVTAYAASDKFGVTEIYPSVGREWFLPCTNIQLDPQVFDEDNSITYLSPGVYTMSADTTRVSIISLDGGAWWRNIEMTMYTQQIQIHPDAGTGQTPHWELYARGERHSGNAANFSSINKGVVAPISTVTWPWYPQSPGPMDLHCVGTAYHGNIYPITGRTHVENELTHIDGYGITSHNELFFSVPGGGLWGQNWFGFKTIVRNENSNTNVRIETWLDPLGNNQWVQGSVSDDVGTWNSRTTTIDGCDAAPYNYVWNATIMTWAGPWASFRSDSQTINVRAMSIREIAPLP